jgi:transcriptional regulator with XRE-family HTH domain
MENAKNFSDDLRAARAAAKISQLELALRLEVSQRHISFVENGKAHPSRELLGRWLAELNLPLRDQNRLTSEAGFAPQFTNAKLTDPQLAQAMQALSYLLEKYEPLPCFVMDEHWNLLQSNRAAQWLIADVMPSYLKPATEVPINMLELLIAPKGLASQFLNLEQVGPQLLAYLKPQSRGDSAVQQKLRIFEKLIEEKTGSGLINASETQANLPLSPLMTIRLNTSIGELSFFSMFTTFGTPYDITLASIRVEHFFAADEKTLERMTKALAF